MGDVFILGAGFSRAVSGHMPLLGDLGRAVHQGLELPEGDVPFAGDVELWLTYLSQSHPWLSEAENLRNRALFVEVSHAIADVVMERINCIVPGDCPDWLRALIQCWHEAQATVITLNYDTLVERAAQEAGERDRPIPCEFLYPATLTPGGGGFGTYATSDTRDVTFQFHKLHGSVNWFYSGASSYQGEAIHYVPVKGRWSAPDAEREAYHARFVADKVPLIAPPLTEKLPYFQHEAIRSMWAQAAIALRDAERVFSIGYSLPKTDITMRFFLEGNSSRSVRLHVVNPDPAALTHYNSVLGHCYQVDGTYVTDDPMRLLVRDLIVEGSGK